MNTCDALWLGTIPYQAAWDLQNRLAGEIAAQKRPPTLLLLEHPHTFTFGRSGQAVNLLWNQAELAHHNVEVHWVDRGGDITYHGPGQLVGYPLIPLGPAIPEEPSRIPKSDYTGYLRRLEETIISLLAQNNVKGFRLPGLTGVWALQPGQSQPAKIAAIGVKVDRFGISRHGFSLNLQPDMRYFDGIIPCGLASHPVTSLSALITPSPTAQAIAPIAAAVFGRIFDFTINFIEKNGDVGLNNI